MYIIKYHVLNITIKNHIIVNMLWADSNQKSVSYARNITNKNVSETIMQNPKLTFKIQYKRPENYSENYINKKSIKNV